MINNNEGNHLFNILLKIHHLDNKIINFKCYENGMAYNFVLN